jgi:monofunctional glycosyltransferase
VEPGGPGPGRLNASEPATRLPTDEPWLTKPMRAALTGSRRGHLDRLGFQPVEDAGIEGPASYREPSEDDCTTRPEKVAELIAAEGTA